MFKYDDALSQIVSSNNDFQIFPNNLSTIYDFSWQAGLNLNTYFSDVCPLALGQHTHSNRFVISEIFTRVDSVKHRLSTSGVVSSNRDASNLQVETKDIYILMCFYVHPLWFSR